MSVRGRSIGRLSRDLQYIRGAHESLKGLMELQQGLTKRAIEERDAAVAKQIFGFYEEEVPQFQQGAPVHELLSLVTAEEVTGYVQQIHRLRRVLEWLDIQGGLGYESISRIRLALAGKPHDSHQG